MSYDDILVFDLERHGHDVLGERAIRYKKRAFSLTIGGVVCPENFDLVFLFHVHKDHGPQKVADRIFDMIWRWFESEDGVNYKDAGVVYDNGTFKITLSEAPDLHKKVMDRVTQIIKENITCKI